MIYNIYFEVAAAAFLAVLNIHIRLQYGSESQRNRQFKNLALTMLAAIVLDIATAITISYAADVPVWVNMLLNFLYFSTDILLEYQFVMYCMSCRDKAIPAVNCTAKVISALSIAALAVNFGTGVIFSFENGRYVHGPFYMIVYAVPIIAIAASIILLLGCFGKFNRNQRIAVVLYSLIAASGPVVQLLYPDVLFTLFAVALGFLNLTFSLETPDYQALNSAMKELRRTKDEAEEAMAAAQTANSVKSEFLSAMSHEIRTPINAILGYAETISRETGDNSSAVYSASIAAAGKNLLMIVDEIMYYTEIETDTFSLADVDYSSASFIMDIISEGEYYTEKSGLEFKVNIDENIPAVLHGDPGALAQIFGNILSNAAKYTKEGFVEIGVKWENIGNNTGAVSAYIKDTGIGMKEEDVENISASFVRLDKKNTQNIPGIGLGLTIVTKLLTFMNSRLDVRSEYGKGTEMSFRIVQGITDSTPVGAVRTAAAVGEEPEAADFTAPEAKILAVDDNKINLELVLRSLKETKAVIDTASNGAEALELIKSNRYDLIFLDHMMPVMDGLEALKIIKENDLCPNVPIIVVTANAVSGEREMYLKAGFDDYASKPVTSKKLKELMFRYLPDGLIIENSDIPVKEEEKDTGISGRFPFLNTESGLVYCCNDEDFYVQIISTYVEENKTDLIMQYFNEKDIENYRIQVHALKGTSRTIGAEYISEEAFKLEKAARANDLDYINGNTDRFIKEYNELIEKLKTAIC